MPKACARLGQQCVYSICALAGNEFWLFPNLLSDQVDILGAFVPVISFTKPEDGKAHWGTRIGGVFGSAAMIYMLYVYSPDEKTIIKDVKGMGDSILDMFNNAQVRASPWFHLRAWVRHLCAYGPFLTRSIGQAW
jgi:hypothetical protein